MATLNITIESLQLEYRTVLDTILANASMNEPRGQRVHDAGYTVLEVAQPLYPQLPVETGRGVSLDIAAIEAIQLVAGVDKSDLVLKIAPQFREYANVRGTGDDGDPMRQYFHGNYGGRMRVFFDCLCGRDVWHGSWLECAVHKVKNDRDTRQAVINIWDNRLDNGVAGANDYPCTVAIGLRVFRGRLDMHVTMRSNDAWKGLPYDVFQFNQAHLTAASMLQTPPGRYYHNAWSMHVYEPDVEKVADVYDRSYLSSTVLPRGFDHVYDAVEVLSYLDSDRYALSPAQEWYAQRLHKYTTDENETEEKTGA